MKEVLSNKQISDGEAHKLGYLDHTEMKSNRMKCRQNTSQETKGNACYLNTGITLCTKSDKEPINVLIQKQISSLMKLE